MEKITQLLIDVANYLLGGKSLAYYIGGIIVVFAGSFLSRTVHSKMKYKTAVKSPQKFSVWFMIWDGANKIAATLILACFLLRIFDLTNFSLLVSVSFFIGAGVDTAIQVVMNNFNFLDFLNRDRSNFEKNKNDNKDNQNSQPVNNPPTNQ